MAAIGLATAMVAAASSAWASAPQADLAAYLRARAAEADGRADLALAGYAAALTASPDNANVAARAYQEALAAGDDAMLARADKTLGRLGQRPRGAVLLDVADAVHARDAKRIDAAITALGRTPFAFLAPSLAAWRVFDRNPKRYVAPVDPPQATALAKRYDEENAALLMIATRDYAGGADRVRTILAADASRRGLARDAAALLVAAGRSELARPLLEDAPLPLPAKPSLAFGASRMFERLAEDLAASDDSASGPNPLVIVLTRATLRIDPGQDEARLVLARALAQQDDDDRGLAALDPIPPNSPVYADASDLRIAILGAAGRGDRALAVARDLSARTDATSDAIARYGDLLTTAGRNADAAKVYGQAIAKAGAAADWTLYLRQGGAYDEAGDWAAARPLIVKAAALAPDQAVTLNYLGYGDLEHGGDVATATALLQKASALKPNDPAITDSLGWAYVKGGQPKRAVPLLQRAAQGSPADVTVNDHLGDALWAIGRRWEARYAWQAALTAASDAPEIQRITDKLSRSPTRRR